MATMSVIVVGVWIGVIVEESGPTMTTLSSINIKRNTGYTKH